ncbi:hypothetical protein B566_EDAN010613 [Ephemera danica]|nr:hypothetical protein B566_EDAN010613 [Ephemera danica]
MSESIFVISFQIYFIWLSLKLYMNHCNGNAKFEKVPPDKGPISSQGKSNHTAELRLEELDFVPVCEITGREAVSAIHRARTQQCKQELANITCLAQQKQLYAERLQSLCPAPGVVAGKPFGCFQDERTFRLLSGYYANLKHTNSPQQCINLCLQSGFQFAGVQYSTECFCGNDEPPASARLPDSSCNMPCPGDPHKACGGFFTVSVFQTGLAKSPSLPPKSAPDPSEPRARVAYLLTLNGRASRQVRRLIRALFHPDHFFYIHVDARQDYMFREMLKLEHHLHDHVKVARNRLATIWGGASLLQVLLASMRELLSLHHQWPWDFVINLSESDFPLKSNEQLVQFLTANKERNFVKSFGREVQRFIQKQGLDKTFHECENHMWRVGDRTLPWGIQMDGGSDWVALAHPFVEYVASGNDDELLTGLKTVFHHTLLPAESFFHTALRNSHLCETYVDNNLHVTNWRRRLGCKCQYRHVVDWCGCSPNDFKPADWSRLQATEDRQVYFARKFEPIVSQAVIKQLEEWLYGPHLPGTAGLDSYWQSIWHKDDVTPPADDALVTVGQSLSRLAIRTLCPGLQVFDLIEMTSYHHEDAHLVSLFLARLFFPVIHTDSCNELIPYYCAMIIQTICITHNLTYFRACFLPCCNDCMWWQLVHFFVSRFLLNTLKTQHFHTLKSQN